MRRTSDVFTRFSSLAPEPFANREARSAPSHFAAAHWRELVRGGKPVDARIINTTSVSGIYGHPGQSNYGAAKAGIAAFTITTARELRRYGITVNAVAPNALTRMTEDLPIGQASEEQKNAGMDGRDLD